MITEKEHALQTGTAKIMLYGVLLAAAVMLFGGGIFLWHHGSNPPGDHIFHGEPHALRSPRAILEDALKGSDPAVIQFGVLLLLLNPLARVLFTCIGYFRSQDWLYTAVSTLVFLILLGSFFL